MNTAFSLPGAPQEPRKWFINHPFVDEDGWISVKSFCKALKQLKAGFVRKDIKSILSYLDPKTIGR